jgi:putative membrane protein
MWGSTITAYLHYIGFMLAFAALTLEQFTLKPDLSVQAARRMVWTDAIYGLSATIVLVTGILRVLYFGKGPEYYLHNPAFYAKVGIFFLVGALSLYPTISFLTWIRALRNDTPPSLERAQVDRLSWVIKIELFGLLLIPLLAAAMARGISLTVSL